LAEHVLGKDEVTSSILVIGSTLRSRMQAKDAHHSSRGNASERRWADRAADVKLGMASQPRILSCSDLSTVARGAKVEGGLQQVWGRDDKTRGR
jgi:hypothetical protein